MLWCSLSMKSSLTSWKILIRKYFPHMKVGQKPADRRKNMRRNWQRSAPMVKNTGRFSAEYIPLIQRKYCQRRDLWKSENLPPGKRRNRWLRRLWRYYDQSTGFIPWSLQDIEWYAAAYGRAWNRVNTLSVREKERWNESRILRGRPGVMNG